MLRAPSLLILLAACHTAPQEANPPVQGELTLESPAAGAWTQAGPFQVSGTATEAESVTVNGEPMSLSKDGSFSGEITLEQGINLVEALAVETDGDTMFARHGVISGEFGEAEGPVQESLFLRLNQGGLDAVLDLAGGMLAPEALNDTVAGANPVYYDEFLWGLVTISADIASIDYGTPRLTANPITGELEATIELPDLEVVVQMETTLGDPSVTVTADPAEVRVGMGIDVVDGQLAVNLNWAEVELHDFFFDSSLISGDLLDYIPGVQDSIRSTLEDLLLEQIETLVPETVDELLGGLDLSFETEVMGLAVSAGAEFVNASVDNDGILATMDVDLSVPAGGDTPYYEGVLIAPVDTAELDTLADISIAASDDLMNRVMFEVWRGGVLNLDLTSEEEPLLNLLFLQLQAPNGGAIHTNAVLPPVIAGNGESVQVQVAELGLVIDTPDGTLGEHVDMAASAYVDLEMRIEDGALHVAPGELDLLLGVRESDWLARDETVTRLIEAKLPLDQLLGLVAIDPIPLDLIDGLTFREATVVHSGSFTEVEIDLVAQ